MKFFGGSGETTPFSSGIWGSPMAALTPGGFLGIIPFLGRRLFMERWNLYLDERLTKSKPRNVLSDFASVHMGDACVSRPLGAQEMRVQSNQVRKEYSQKHQSSQISPQGIWNSLRGLKYRCLSRVEPICHSGGVNYFTQIHLTRLSQVGPRYMRHGKRW